VVPLAPAVRVAAERPRLTEIVLGIRPEQMHLTEVGTSDTVPAAGGPARSGASPASADPGSAVLLGDVVLVEELGADALLHVRLADDGGSVVARAEGRKPPAPGQRVAFRVESADVLGFNPANGARLAG
jgi:ABC-type sugar transport system ATPase subunit